MAAEDDSDFSDVDLDTIRERAGRHAAAKRSAQREGQTASPRPDIVFNESNCVSTPLIDLFVRGPENKPTFDESRQEARRPHVLDDTIREALDEMTEAVDLLVSPQLARHEIRALCRSMTEEVDAAAAPQLGRSLKRVARADFEAWLADRKTRWRAVRGYVAPKAVGEEAARRRIAALCRDMTRRVHAALAPKSNGGAVRVALSAPRRADVALTAAPATPAELDAVRRLNVGEFVKPDGAYNLLRRLSLAHDASAFPVGFAVHGSTGAIEPFTTPHLAFFVSKAVRGDRVLSEDAIRVRFQPGAFWWDPQDPTRGVNARTMSRFRLNGNEISTEDNHGYWGREFKLVQRSDARQKGGSIDLTASVSLVQIWKTSLVPNDEAPGQRGCGLYIKGGRSGQAYSVGGRQPRRRNRRRRVRRPDEWEDNDASDSEPADHGNEWSRADGAVFSDESDAEASHSDGSESPDGTEALDVADFRAPLVLAPSVARGTQSRPRTEPTPAPEPKPAPAPAPKPEPEPEPASWVQCVACDKWRVVDADTAALAASSSWTCTDGGITCSKMACSAGDDPDCECHQRGWDRQVLLVSPTGDVLAHYCSPRGAGAINGMSKSLVDQCCRVEADGRQNVFRYASEFVADSSVATPAPSVSLPTPSVPSTSCLPRGTRVRVEDPRFAGQTGTVAGEKHGWNIVNLDADGAKFIRPKFLRKADGPPRAKASPREPSGGSARRRSAPQRDSEQDAVGRRVWALFEPDVWWCGTVVSVSGVADARCYSIVFDDGVRQSMWLRDVFEQPPSGAKIGARGPNAQARLVVEKALSPKAPLKREHEATTPRPKPSARKRARRRSPAAAPAEPVAPVTPPATPVAAPSGDCPICYERLAADATVFDCAHALCASCSETYAKVEAERSMSRRSGVSIACPLCRKKARVALPAGMY